MVMGIGNVDYIRQGSQVTVANQPNWSFIYTASAVKDNKYNVGDRVVTPDGRAFRYSKAAATCDPELGAYIGLKTVTNAVAPVQAVINGPVINQFGGNATAVAGAVGSNVVTMTVAAGNGAAADGALAQDELRGGYIVIGNGAGQHPQTRGIIGNTVVAIGGGSCDVYLDAPLVTAVTVATTNIETMLNPYANMKGDGAGGAYVTFLGIPAMRATVGQYFWLQTWGPVWITSDGLTADDANDRLVYFQGNGSLSSRTEVTGDLYQMAGLVIDASSAGASNAPFVLLQITP